jgi:uncharacterized protein (TIGR03435 family)
MNTFGDALTKALVDFVWQGALAGLALAAALRLLRGRSAQARYLASSLALIILVALPVVTTARRYAGPSSNSAIPDTAIAAAEERGQGVYVSENILLAGGDESPFDDFQAWVLPIWSVGVLLLSLRLLVGGAEVRALRRSGEAADEALRALVARLAGRMGISRAVQVITSARPESPSVIGWLRPVVLIPPAALMGLTADQLEAVLAHELAHIRRHDYLVNIVQMVAEALLFYHPAVWWVSRQMRLERELCCDDEAVRVCGDAGAYARALVTMARLQVPTMAMGSAGGSLSDRVRHLMGLDRGEPRRAAAVGAVALALTLVFTVLAANSVYGQVVLARFEVASIKPSPVNVRGAFQTAPELLPGGVIRATRMPLFLLINAAYGLSWKQLVWEQDVANERFDIDARAGANLLPADGSEPNANQAKVLREMLQTLLAERFKLKIHTEKRDRDIYALVVAPNGHRLKPTAKPACSAASSCRGGGGPADGLRFDNAPLSRLVDALNAFLERPVVDRTGLTGRYDIEIPPWSPSYTPPPQPPAPGQLPEPQANPNDASIFTVLIEALGLKLESTRGPIDMFIVDHIERPTPD